MKSKVPHSIKSLIKISLTITPACPSATPYKFATSLRDLQDFCVMDVRWAWRKKGDSVQAGFLGPRGAKHNQPADRLNLTQTKATTLSPPLACKDQQANNIRELIL